MSQHGGNRASSHKKLLRVCAHFGLKSTSLTPTATCTPSLSHTDSRY
jgi:hypothetical protein